MTTAKNNSPLIRPGGRAGWVSEAATPLCSLPPRGPAKHAAVFLDPRPPELHVLGSVEQRLAAGLPGHIADDDGRSMQVGAKLQVSRRLLVAGERQVPGAGILAVIFGKFDHVGNDIQRFSRFLAGSPRELIDRDVLDGGHDRRAGGFGGRKAVFHGCRGGFAKILDPAQPRDPRIIGPLAEARAIAWIASGE